MSKLPPSKTFIISACLVAIALAAIYSNFTGVFHVKLGIEGGELLIDKRTPPINSQN